jgi:hypothetical protein
MLKAAMVKSAMVQRLTVGLADNFFIDSIRFQFFHLNTLAVEFNPMPKRLFISFYFGLSSYPDDYDV